MSYVRRFDKRLTLIPNEIWSKITQIESIKGQWIAGNNLSPQFLGRLKRSILITSTGASTRIEGSKMSDEDVEKLMQGIAIQKFADRDSQEVKGYFELLQNVFESYEDINFSENAIKHFHQELLKYVDKDKFHRGKYKSKENRVEMVDTNGKRIGVIFDTTPAYLTPKQMQELVEWTKNALENKKYHPLLIIGNFLVEFLSIHPFEDRNGRLSRILTNYLMLKVAYLYMPYVSHEKLIEDQKPNYYIALRKTQKTLRTTYSSFGGKKEDITFWLNFFLSVILAQSKMAINLIKEEDIEDLLSPNQLSVWQYLQSINEASPDQIAKKAKVARSTVNQVLNKLLRLKRISRIGEGSSTRYKIKD